MRQPLSSAFCQITYSPLIIWQKLWHLIRIICAFTLTTQVRGWCDRPRACACVWTASMASLSWQCFLQASWNRGSNGRSRDRILYPQMRLYRFLSRRATEDPSKKDLWWVNIGWSLGAMLVFVCEKFDWWISFWDQYGTRAFIAVLLFSCAYRR